MFYLTFGTLFFSSRTGDSLLSSVVSGSTDCLLTAELGGFSAGGLNALPALNSSTLEAA